MADILLADRVSRLRPTAVNRVVAGQCGQLEAEGRSLVSLMRGQPDTPTPAHIVVAAETLVARWPHRLSRQPRGAEPARSRRREAAPCSSISYNIRSGSGNPHHRLRNSAALAPRPGRPGRTGVRRSAARSRSTMPIPLPSCCGAAGLFNVPSLQRWVICPPLDPALAFSKPSGHPAPEIVLLLNTPWNPVGTVMTRDELCVVMAFAEAAHDPRGAERRDTDTLDDDGRQHVSPTSLYRSEVMARCVLLVNSLSKTYAMTGSVSLAIVPGPCRLSGRCCWCFSSRAAVRRRSFRMRRRVR